MVVLIFEFKLLQRNSSCMVFETSVPSQQCMILITDYISISRDSSHAGCRVVPV